MVERTTTVEIDDRGRTTIPRTARKALGIHGKDAFAEITIRNVTLKEEEDDDR